MTPLVSLFNCLTFLSQVPIVKFRSTKYNLEGDISLYNILAQRNTLMLYKYSQVDERVRTLGYTVKEFAKVQPLSYSTSMSKSLPQCLKWKYI